MRENRRRFLKNSFAAVLAAGGSRFAAAGAGTALAAEDRPNTHNMLVFGQETMFLSHLPMFAGVNETKTEFTSPHRYQVILEASPTSAAGQSLLSLYSNDRHDHPDVSIYTLNPQQFVLPRLFAPPAGTPRLDKFSAAVFRGHLERGGRKIPGLEKAVVKVTRVVHAKKFDPQVTKPERLEYILFGAGSELFAAHAITAPPDFDHVLAVTIDGRDLSKEELAGEIRAVVDARENLAAKRLREGETADATLTVNGTPASATVRVKAGREFYFEEGELFVPPTFDDTDEEKKAAGPR